MESRRGRHPVALTAAGFGALAGMRSLSAPALLARRLADLRGRRPRGLPERLLASRGSAVLLGALAAGEMLSDKAPFIPARTDPLPLAGRAAMGALCGAALAGWRRQPRLGPALVGGTAAVGAAFAAYHARRIAGERSEVPDPLLGVAEDALVLGLGALLTRSVG